MYLQSKIKKPFLYALVGSVLVGTLLGISFVIRNTWSWFEVRVILTTIAVAVASLCGLACDLARLPKGSNWLPKLGVMLSGLAGAMLLGGLWIEPHSESYWKTTACVSILTVATVHLSLLSIAKLDTRFQWLYVLGSQIIAGFALLLCSLLIFEVDATGIWQLIAALSIVVTTCFGRVDWAVSALTDHFSRVWWACVEDSLSHPTLQAIPNTGRYFGTTP